MYWSIDLDNKLNYIERSLNSEETNEETKDQVSTNLKVLYNEIKKELKNNPNIPFEHLDKLNPESINSEVIAAGHAYVALIKKYNIKLYNKASAEKDKLINQMQSTEEGKEHYFELRRNHHNTTLKDFATNSSEMERIIEYKNQLFQKNNPIYMDPPGKLIKAHFYAPRKQVFGTYFNTFGVNVAFIWFMTLTLYIMLYFRVLKRLLDSFEQLSDRFKMKKE